MEGTKLIHQFFDEGVSASEEDSLFQALAGDQILRQEFLEHMKISSFIKHDISVTTPPSELTNAVFTGIGLPSPVEYQTSGAAKGKSGRFLRFLPLILTVLVTVSLTSGVYYISVDSEGGTGTNSASLMTGSRMLEPDNIASTDAELSADAYVGSQESSESSSPDAMNNSSLEVMPSKTKQIEVNSTTSQPAQAIVRDETAITEGIDNAIPEVAEAVPETALLPGLRSDDLSNMDVPSAPIHVSVPLRTQDDQALPEYGILGMPEGQTPFTVANFIFQFRMMGLTTSSVSNGVPTPTEGLFKNMAISGLYKLSEKHALGFSYGREPIPRVYVRMDAVAKTGTSTTGPEDPVKEAVEHRDFNMLDWGGVAWKMSHTNISLLNTFYPYTQMFAGATKYGPLGRAMVGLEMYPSNNSMINVGIEFSSLTYQVENNWYSTNAIGASFGIAISF
jgi:hypothetical protein